MKKLLVLLCIGFGMKAFAQEYSDESASALLATYITLKDQAKDSEDYQMAAYYKDKITQLYELKNKSAQLKVAAEEENFELASQLQQEIKDGWAAVNGLATSAPEPEPAKAKTRTTLSDQMSTLGFGVAKEKPAKVVSPAMSGGHDLSIKRMDHASLGLSNLQLGDNVNIYFSTGTYLNFLSTPLTGQGKYMAEHGPIGGLHIGYSFFDPYQAGYDIQTMNAQLGGGYAISLDAWTLFSTVELTAISWSVWDSDFAGIDPESNFAAFPQGAASLRLGTIFRPFFNYNAESGMGDKYRCFNMFIDIPMSGGDAYLMLGYSENIFR